MEFLNYAKFLNANEEVIFWVEHNLKNYIEKNEAKISEVEHIIDFLVSDKAPKRMKKLSYKQAKIDAENWGKKLQEEAKKIKESGGDTELIHDFKNGFKIVKLIGENAYKREGKLMGHCVASYFGKNDEIFSLRDKNNNPHCTMSKSSQQIKGKGNGEIHPKYINYVVKFLELSGIEVRESEMNNLGYIIPKFYNFVENKLYKNKYLRKNEKIKYKKNVNIIKEIKNEIKGKINLFDNDLIIRANINTSVVAISCSVYVRENATFTAPALTEVSGSVYVHKNATFTAPALTEVSGYVDVQENATFTAPALTEVSGSVDVEENATFTALALKKSGYVYVEDNATFTAPALKMSGKK